MWGRNQIGTGDHGGGEPFPGLLVSGERMFDNGKGRATRQNPERARGGNDRCGGGIRSEPAIMGVVNLSPDSWYRESVCLTTERAVQRGKILSAQGAGMIDVGAESTLAHAARLDEAGQQRKLLPVVKELAAANLIVSVETYQKEVARASLGAGAKVINLTGMED